MPNRLKSRYLKRRRIQTALQQKYFMCNLKFELLAGPRASPRAPTLQGLYQSHTYMALGTNVRIVPIVDILTLGLTLGPAPDLVRRQIDHRMIKFLEALERRSRWSLVLAGLAVLALDLLRSPLKDSSPG